jgi:hypothetical protein
VGSIPNKRNKNPQFILKLHDGNNLENKNISENGIQNVYYTLEFEETDQLKIHAITKADCQKYLRK